MYVHYGCTICLMKSNRERTVMNGNEIGIHSRLFPPAYRPAGPFPVNAFGSTKGAIEIRVTVNEHECTAMRSAFIHVYFRPFPVEPFVFNEDASKRRLTVNER